MPGPGPPSRPPADGAEVDGPAFSSPANPAAFQVKARRDIGFFEFLRQSQDNPLRNWTAESFSEDVIYNRLLFTKFILLNNPEFIKHVLTDNAANYHKSRIGLSILKHGLGNGLLTSEGAFWLRQRRIINPAFHHRRVAAMADTMTGETAITLDLMDRASVSGRPLEILEEMMALTLRIIVATMFSGDIGNRTALVHHHLTKIQEMTGRPPVADLFGLPPWFRRRRHVEAERSQKVLDDIVDEIIAGRRRAGGDRGDLLDMLLAARDEETGTGMDDRQVRDEVMTIFAAGHETTANALTWTLYLVAQHPDVEARLWTELDTVLAGRAPTYADLAALPYARMVIDESLRLFPPAHIFGRSALAPDRVGGHRIPTGAEVMVSPWVLHRHKKLWKDPERFDPERFAPGVADGRHAYAYLPFGGGPRTCIGRGFALVEAHLLLVMIAQRFRLRLKPGHPVEPLALITLRPRFGMPMLVTRR